MEDIEKFNRNVSEDTVKGIIYRLLGGRYKLIGENKSKINQNNIVENLFKDNLVSFYENVYYENKEMVYLRKKDLTYDQVVYSGVIKDYDFINHDLISKILSLVFYTSDELISFIENGLFLSNKDKVDCVLKFSSILSEKIKDKSLIIANFENKNELIEKIQLNINAMDGVSVIEKSNLLILAINKAVFDNYDEIIRLDKKMSYYITKNKVFSGFSYSSAASFTERDFKSKFASKKNIFGAPFIFTAGKKTTPILRKKTGELVINIDCDENESLLIKNLIQSAGVGSFVVGKKGLAYVREII